MSLWQNIKMRFFENASTNSLSIYNKGSLIKDINVNLNPLYHINVLERIIFKLEVDISSI